MPELNKQIPSYDQATFEMMSAIISEIENQASIMRFLGPGRMTRHGGVIRNIQGEEPLDQSYKQVSTQLNIDYQIIRNTDITAYSRILIEMGQAFVHKQSASFIKSLDEMLDHAKTQKQSITKRTLDENQ